MSSQHNETIHEQIEMHFLVESANYSFENLLDELQMTYQEAYSEKLTTDCLIDLLIQKRFDESPQL